MRGPWGAGHNQAWADIHGYDSADEIFALGSIERTIAPVERDRVKRYADTLMAGGDIPTDYERRGVRKDGSLIWLNVRAGAVNWDGETAILATYFDVTERKRAEHALRDSEARYRELFEESPVVIWEDDWSDVKRMLDDLSAGGVTNLRKFFEDNTDKLHQAFDLTKIVAISRATREMFGEPNKQALMDRSTAALEPKEEVDGFLGGMIAFADGSVSYEYESPSFGHEGAPIVTANRVVMPPNHRHDWSRVIYAIEDITERKEAEIALAASERRFRNLAEHSIQGIIVHRDDQPLFANSTFAHILGYDDPDDVMSLTTLDAFKAPEERKRLRRYREDRTRGLPAPVSYEFQAIRKDGTSVRTAVTN